MEQQRLFQDILPDDFLQFSFGGKSYSENIKTEVVKSDLSAGIKVFLCKSEGIEFVKAEMNFKFFGGSLGCAEGEILAQAFEYARAHKIGVMIIARSGGVRMQEGTTALMMMAKASVAVNAHKQAGLGYVTIFEDPCYGGVSASYCMQGDIRIGVKGTRIGFAGPNVILNTMYNQNQAEFDKAAPQGFQSAEFTYDNGQLDLVAEDLDSAVRSGVHFLRLLSQGAEEVNSEDKLKVDVDAVVKAFELDDASNKDREINHRDHQRARDLTRIQAQDLCKDMLVDYLELSGDGKMGRDNCIHGGIARLPLYPYLESTDASESSNQEQAKMFRTVVVVGTFKAHNEAEFAKMGYGMATPHGYRTALKLFDLAERFHLPIITFIDTVGAEPSFAAECHGQSEAIATNLLRMSSLKVPVLSCVLSEGGSGGALGVGMGNSVAMFSSAWYGVISPEGAASILGRYKDAAHKKEQFPKDAAALASIQQIYADQLQKRKVIDQIIWEEEDLGKQRETFESFPHLKKRLLQWLWHELVQYDHMEPDAIMQHRYQRFRSIGPFIRGNEELLQNWKDEVAAKEEQKQNRPQVPRSKPITGDALPRFVKLIGDIALNGQHAQLKTNSKLTFRQPISLPSQQSKAIMDEFRSSLTSEEKTLLAENAKTILDRDGPNAVRDWLIRNREKRVLVTDTTLRDAHQSLHATRMRTIDMIGAAKEMSSVLENAFSLEMWGGATFDVSLRFLHEDPWERVRRLRKLIPNICFQCLLRGSNVVGYANYPDNAVTEFCRKAAEVGIDVFRIFDCFNDVEKMRAATNAVLKAGKIAEVCICYTSDFNDPNEKIYTLDYYCSLAKKIESLGAHILGIKDMAGQLKPQNAAAFVQALRKATNLPIHFHTHNTTGNALATCLNMADAGCEIIDLAISSMADLTSQPSLNGFLAAREHTQRPAYIPFRAVEPLASYFGATRTYYKHLESGQLSSTARAYEHQMPGGQYSNLMKQSAALGIEDKWDQILDMYRDCNNLLGNVIKVTPSSKCVGDLALFLIGKGLTVKDVMDGKIDIVYPKSVVQLFHGDLGYPHHWRPPFTLSPEFIALRERVLRGEPIRNEAVALPDVDFPAVTETVRSKITSRAVNNEDVMSYLMYPDVFESHRKFIDSFGEMATYIPTPVFTYGLHVGQTFTMKVPFNRIDKELVDLLKLTNPGTPVTTSSTSTDPLTETLPRPEDYNEDTEVEFTVTLVRLSGADYYGKRTLTIKVNDQLFAIPVKVSTASGAVSLPKANANDKCEFGSPMAGTVGAINIKAGDKVKKGDELGKVVAMKMEIKLEAPCDGELLQVLVKPGDKVEQNSLLFKFKSN